MRNASSLHVVAIDQSWQTDNSVSRQVHQQ